METEKNGIEGLKLSQEEVFIDIYQKYKESFIAWISKYYTCDKPTASDCFQDAVIVLMNNVRSGKLDRLDSGIKTYLFATGKNILLKKYRLKQKEISINEAFIDDGEWKDEDYSDFELEKDSKIARIAEMVMRMKEPCKSIIKYFYYENLSMDKIALIMNYKNANTVKSQKLRCIKYLENSIEEKN